MGAVVVVVFNYGCRERGGRVTVDVSEVTFDHPQVLSVRCRSQLPGSGNQKRFIKTKTKNESVLWYTS